METTSREQQELATRLYDAYGKPLEDKHRGEYVAISEQGQTVLKPSLLEVAQAAAQVLGPGAFVFKVGERAVGKWR